MAAEQDVGGIALGLTLETSGWSSGIARAKAELEGLKRSAAGLEIGVGVATRGGARSATAVGGGPAVVAGIPGGGVGAASPVISPRFQVSAQSVRQLRVDINAQLRSLGVAGEAVAVPVKLGRVPYATMRTEIATGIGEVPIRIKPDAGSLTAFANVLSAMTGATPGRARQAITAAAASRGIPTRAQGGPAAANRPHLVGENGPEIHWPSSSGTYIAPHRALGGTAMRSPVSRGGGIDVDEYARWAIERDRRMGGLGRIKITPDEAGMAHRSMGVHRALRREGMADPVRLKMHREFYDLERQNIEREAKRIGVTGQQLTHVTAALSSNQPWEDNVRQALIAIKAVQSGSRQAGSFANPEQLGITQAILSGKPVTGIKRLPFAEAFYDPNTFPIDRWMGRITTLGMRRGGDPTGSRMDLMQALRGKDWTTSDVPSPSIRRASVYGIEQMAKEWNIDPREAQAEPWGVVRDLNKEAVKHFRLDKKTGLAMPRAGGGRVKPFCSTCGTNVRDPRTHLSTAKHQANARGTSSSKWLGQQPPWAYGYRNQDAQYDPPGFEPNTDWWEGKARGGRVDPRQQARLEQMFNAKQDPSADLENQMLEYRIAATRARGFDPMSGNDREVRQHNLQLLRMQFLNSAIKTHSRTHPSTLNYSSPNEGIEKQLEFMDKFPAHPMPFTRPYSILGGKGDLPKGLYSRSMEVSLEHERPPGIGGGFPGDIFGEDDVRHRGLEGYKKGPGLGEWGRNALGGPVHRMAGGPAFKPVKSDAFYGAVARATQVTRASGRRVGETVHLYGQDEYEGMRTFLSADGTAGYAIKPDGDLVSVFNVGGPGGGKRALRSAIQRGATKLDAFDEAAPTFALGKVDPRDQQKNLPRFYERFGFREVGRDPWDPQYAPEGWKGGTPDVVYMERQKAKRALGGKVDYDDVSPLKDFNHPIYEAARPGPLLLASWKKAATEHMMAQGWHADDAKEWLRNEADSFDMKPVPTAPLRLRTSGRMADVAGFGGAAAEFDRNYYATGARAPAESSQTILARLREETAAKQAFLDSPAGRATISGRVERQMAAEKAAAMAHNVDPITKRLPKGVKIRFSPEFSDYPDPSRFIKTGGAGYHGPDWGQRDRWSDPGQLTMGYFQPIVRNMNSLINALAPGGMNPFFEPRGEADPLPKKWGSLSEWLTKGKWGEDASGFGAGSRARMAAYALDPKNRVLAHTLVEATKQVPSYGPHAGQSVDALKSDYVWTSPEMRGKGLASAMYSRIEKLTGLPLAPSSSQTPFGRKLWSKPASQRSFGRAFQGRTVSREDMEEMNLRNAMIEAGAGTGIDMHGWRAGAEALGTEPFRDFSNAVDPLDRPRRPRRARGQMKLPGFAGGGWAKGEFFGPAKGGFGMWKGRPVDREAVIAWETQLREGAPGMTMADILGNPMNDDINKGGWRHWNAALDKLGPDRKRAQGGDVGKYIIGEIGRELFVPKRMEGIIPPDVAAQIPGTEELLANLMMGRARMAGGGVKEIGGRGSQQWDAPEDGWIIPNRLMHRIARHAGGEVHDHPHPSASGKTWIDESGRQVSRDAQRQGRNRTAIAGRDAALRQRERESQQIARAQPAIRMADLTYSAAFEGPFSTPSAADQGLAEANINAAAARGLTGRAALGGLFGFGFGGRARKSARLEAGALSAEYKSMAPKGQDAIEYRTEKLDDARKSLDGVRKSIEDFGPVTKRTKGTFDELHSSLGKAERAVELEAMGVSKAADIRLREQSALARASGGAVQNFAAVTAAGFAFNVSMQAISVASDLAVQSLKPVVDRLTGFGAVSQQVSKQLAEGLPQAGTLNTLFGQRGMQAGISGRSAGVFEDILGGGVLAKAGATKAGDISQLLRAAFGSGAPTGLTGGYGGIGGGGLFAEQLGGGKGLLEQIAQDVSVTRGGQEGPTGTMDKRFQAGLGAAGRQLRNELRSNLGPAGTNILGPQEDVLTDIQTFTPKQRQAQLESIGVYNEAATRATMATGEMSATLVEDAEAAAKVVEATKGSTNEAERFANQMASVGVVFKDTSGNVLTTRKELEKATGSIAQGLAIPDQAAFAKTQAQSLTATRQAASVRGQLERDVLIPGQLGQQVAANPFMAATSGLQEGFKPTLVSLTRIQSLQNEITRDAQAGVEAQAQLVDTELGSTQGAQFRGYMADVSAYGQQIAGLNEQLANRQAQLGLHQFNFQLRVLNRNIRDARGLAGMAGGSRLGGIQREQYDLGRESQRLALESQRLANEMAQRQINFQVAVAGFQAPGITGQERAARMEEARVEAAFAQQQLDIQKQQTGIGGQQFGLEGEAFKIQTAIAVQDLEAQRGILIESHQLEQEQIAVQKQINALTIRQAQVQAKAQSLFAEATGSFDHNLSTASQYVAQFGGTMASALGAVRRAIDVLTGRRTGEKKEGSVGPGTDETGANGLLGFTGGETTLTVGEVNGEAVAVLKNPRQMNIGGPAGLGAPGGGGGGSTIQIVITGNNISSDMDLETITRKVQDAVETGLSRKAGLLSVSVD